MQSREVRVGFRSVQTFTRSSNFYLISKLEQRSIKDVSRVYIWQLRDCRRSFAGDLRGTANQYFEIGKSGSGKQSKLRNPNILHVEQV